MVALRRATSGKVLLLMSTLLASGAAAEEAEVFIQARSGLQGTKWRS
jgi:hypothetical protein